MRLAVIGSGISGLSAAWLLARRHQVTVFEANDYLGGHTNTVEVTHGGVTAPVDTGFLVFNHRTYPNLRALFRHFAVQTTATEMSFSVSFAEHDIEWAGTNLRTVFAQARNLARPAFLRMLADIVRFNRAATRYVAGDPADRHGLLEPRAGGAGGETLAEFLDRGRYSPAFREWYLLPMAGAIWSCPTATMLAYPMATFARFCVNHGLLQVANRPPWYTVSGGGREYVRRIAARLDDVRLATPVRAVRGAAGALQVKTDSGTATFDNVVLACHSDQALALLADATPAERSVLGRVGYQRNKAILHSDTALLPRRRAAWAAWNYIAAAPATDRMAVGVSYLLNKLQPLPFTDPIVVTLNPPRPVRPDRVIAEFDYEHPVFDSAAIDAQRELAMIQGRRGLWFCGAWAGYGFHEDGLKAGLAVANALGERAPWQLEPAGARGDVPDPVLAPSAG